MQLLILGPQAPAQPLPTFELLPYPFEHLTFSASLQQIRSHQPQVLIVDARQDLLAARNSAQVLKGQGLELPLLMVLTEGGLAAISPDWQVDDIILDSASPAEAQARLRLLVDSRPAEENNPLLLRAGDLTLDEASYSARLQGSPLNLTYKEFELLKFLMQHPGRVFTRAQLLAQVWGYDYYGGTRTVDVHIRRLRSKLGADHEQLISTVRNVGYSFSSRP